MTMERCFGVDYFLRLRERNRFLEEQNASLRERNLFLEGQNASLRQKLEAFKFSESVYKTLANEQRDQTQALMQEVEKLKAEVGELEQQAKQSSQMLVSLTDSVQQTRLHRELCIACINILQVSQKILERIFPNDGTVWVEAVGDILRIMFECSLQHTSYLHSENFENIKFKVHASIPHFLEFCKSFAIFLYHSRIEVYGTEFQVTAIHEPRRERRFFSEDESRFYEYVVFEVEVFCRDTKRTFKLQFSCDSGYSFLEPNFGVNCLSFSGRHGFRVNSPADSCSVLDILRCIIDCKADWHEPMNPHVSILGIILRMLNTRKYRLFGIPHLEEAECPISHERETCMEFSGCGCSFNRQLSLYSVRGIYAASRLNEGGLRCPFCRHQLNYRMYDMGLGDNSIDVSCIDNVPSPEDITFHQFYAVEIPEIYGHADADKQELVDGFAELAKVQGLGFSHPIFRNLPRIPVEDLHLFFPAQVDIPVIDAADASDADVDADVDVDAAIAEAEANADVYADADDDADANDDAADAADADADFAEPHSPRYSG